MKTIYCEKIPRITKTKWELEKTLNVKIFIKNDEVMIDGLPEEEYFAEKIIEAIGLGFPFKTAMLIKEEGIVFEKINIKDYTKRADMETIRGRIIGTGGKTLKTLVELTKCHFEIYKNTVGIIGEAEFVKNAQEAIILLIKGTKHGNVYAYLEHHQIREPGDLGLKEIKKKKSSTITNFK